VALYGRQQEVVGRVSRAGSKRGQQEGLEERSSGGGRELEGMGRGGYRDWQRVGGRGSGVGSLWGGGAWGGGELT